MFGVELYQTGVAGRQKCNGDRVHSYATPEPCTSVGITPLLALYKIIGTESVLYIIINVAKIHERSRICSYFPLNYDMNYIA